MIWSSERNPTSTVQFVGDESILESRSIEVAGLSPSTPIVEDGGKMYALATGSVTADRSSVVEVDRSSCSTRVIPVSGPAYAFDVHDGTITLATAFTDRSEVRRFNLAGQELGSTTIPEVAIGTLLDAGDTIHAFAADAMGEAVDYLSLDPSTLAVREQRTVNGVGVTPINVVLRDANLYFAITIKSEKSGLPDHRLAIFSLSTLTPTFIDVESPIPSMIKPTNDGFLIGHSFLNPALRDAGSYRHVTLVDRTGTQRGADLERPIGTMVVDANRLIVLTQERTEERALVEYRLPGLETVSTTLLDEHAPSPDSYPAAVVPLTS